MDQLLKGILHRSPHRITLRRHSGQKQEFLIRRCEEDDFDDIMALQRKICEEVGDPEIYSLVGEEEIKESLKLDHCFGVYLEGRPAGASAGPVEESCPAGTSAGPAEDAEPAAMDSAPRLVAFTVMIDNRISHRNYGSYVGYSPEQQARCVSMEITVVDEPCRGYGMQKLFVYLREGVALHQGAAEAMVTIGPDNKYSLNNLLESGYEIIDTRPLYEGAMRHILRKRLKEETHRIGHRP